MTSKKTGYLLGAVAGVAVAAGALAATDMRLPMAERSSPNMPLIRTSTAPVFAPPPGAPCRSPIFSSRFRRRWCR